MSKDITEGILLENGFKQDDDDSEKLHYDASYSTIKMEPVGKIYVCKVKSFLSFRFAEVEIQTIDHFNKLMELMNVDFKLKEE